MTLENDNTLFISSPGKVLGPFWDYTAACTEFETCALQTVDSTIFTTSCGSCMSIVLVFVAVFVSTLSCSCQSAAQAIFLKTAVM